MMPNPSETSLYFRVCILLAKQLLIKTSRWDEPFQVALTNDRVQEHFKSELGIPWSAVRKVIDKLKLDNVVEVVSGSGRGRFTTIRFVKHPSDLLARYSREYGDELTAQEKDDIENIIRRLRSDEAELPNLAWWGNEESQITSEFLYAPPAALAFGEDTFIGRKDFVPRLTAALWQHTVVALIGHPGTGKTHVISWYLHHLLKQRPQGIRIYWVEVTGQLAQDTLDILVDDFLKRTKNRGLEGSSTSPVANRVSQPSTVAYALLAELRANRYLLVFDNFEKALDESAVPKDEGYKYFLRLLLDHEIGQSRVLLISHWVPKDSRGREPIPIELEGMNPTDGSAYLRHIGVTVTDRSARKIVTTLNGNPLAMQVQRTRLLENPDDLDLRLPSEAIGNAIDDLSENEKLITAAVAILGNHATEPNIREVLKDQLLSSHAAQETDLESILDRLVHTKRILTSISRHHVGTRTYGLHQLIRAYVTETALTEPIVKELHQNALHYWIEQADPRKPLSEEWMLALSHSTQAECYEVSAEILFKDEVAIHLLRGGRPSQLLIILERLISEASDPLDEAPRTVIRRTEERSIDNWIAEIYRMLGQVNWRLGKLGRAEAYYRRLLDLPLAGASRPRDQAALAGVLLDHTSLPEGLEAANEALRLAKEGDDAIAEMEAWNWIGYALDDMNNLEEAAHAYNRALELNDRQGEKRDDTIACLAETRLGMLYWRATRVEESRPHFETALRIASQLRDPYYLGMTQGNMGHYFMDKGNRTEADLATAVNYYMQASKTHEGAGVMRGVGYWRGQLGRAHFFQGSTGNAKKLLKQAVDIHIEVGERGGVARHLRHLALPYIRGKNETDRTKGMAYHLAAIDLFLSLGIVAEITPTEAEFAGAAEHINPNELQHLRRLAVPYVNVITHYIETKSGRLP